MGDLGTIDDQFDIAVSTACGALDHIVVDTTTTGQQCVDFLKQHRLGRATFIVLDKMHAPAGKQRYPEGAQRLFDLVKPNEPRFAPAFYHGLRDTLVAEDLAQANRVAYNGPQRYRVVTLDGKLIDRSGTMSGGGQRVSRGGMSSRVVAAAMADGPASPADIARLEGERQEAEAEWRQLVEEKQKVDAELHEKREMLPNHQMQMHRAHLDLTSSKEQIELLKQRVAHLEEEQARQASANAVDAHAERAETLTALIATRQGELATLQTSCAAIEADMEGLRSKILEVGGTALRAQKGRVDMIRDRLKQFATMRTRIKSKRAAADKQLKTSSSTVQSASTELEQITTEVEAVTTRLSTVSATLETLKRNHDALKETLVEKREATNDIEAALKEKKEALKKWRKREVDLTQKIQVAQQAIGNAKKLQESLARSLAELKLNPLEFFLVLFFSFDHIYSKKTGSDEDESMEGLKQYTPEELAELDVPEMSARVSQLEAELGGLTLNMDILRQYREREAEYNSRAQDLQAISEQRNQTLLEYDALRQQRLTEFMDGLANVSVKLKEMYQMITLGGNAELELVDSMDPFSEGIQFSVMPPQKSWKSISNLSGGEKVFLSDSPGPRHMS